MGRLQGTGTENYITRSLMPLRKAEISFCLGVKEGVVNLCGIKNGGGST